MKHLVIAAKFLGGGMLLACLPSCGGRQDVNPAVTQQVTKPHGGAHHAGLRTELTAYEIQAGTEVVARCRLDGQTPPPELNLAVFVDPPPANVLEEGHGARLALTAAGPYAVTCQSSDGSVVDREGATLLVRPAQPVSWKPEFGSKPCFSPGEALPFHAKARDRFGNAVKDPKVRLSVTPPAEVLRGEDGRYRLLEEGVFELAFALEGDQANEAMPPPVRIFVRVDATGPQLVLPTLERGAVLKQGLVTESPVLIAGTAFDTTSPLQQIQIGEHAVPVSGNRLEESFALPVMTPWGLSVAHLRAVDICGNATVKNHAILRSPAFYKAATRTSGRARVPGAMRIQLGQDVLDDFDRTDLDELATLAEEALGALDLDAELPAGTLIAEDEVSNRCGTWDAWVKRGYKIRRHPDPAQRIRVEGPHISHLEFVASGLRAHIYAEKLYFPARARIVLRECLGGQVATQSASANVFARIDRLALTGLFALGLNDHDPQVNLESVSAQVTGVHLEIACEKLSAVCDELADVLADDVASAARVQIEKTLAEDVANTLKVALGSARLTGPVTLPAPLDTRLEVESGLDALVLCGPDAGLPASPWCSAAATLAGYGALVFHGQFFPTERGLGVPDLPYGSIKYGATATPVLEPTADLEVTLSIDAANQLLWATWYAGGFHLDLASLAETSERQLPSGMQITIAPTMPPVLMPGSHEAPLQMGFGDVFVEVASQTDEDTSAEPLRLGLYVTVIADAFINADPQAASLNVALNSDALIYLDVESLSGAQPDTGEAQLSAILEPMFVAMLPQLLAKAASSLPLPRIDLGAVSPAHEGRSWCVDEPRVHVRNGLVSLRGDLGLCEDPQGS